MSYNLKAQIPVSVTDTCFLFGADTQADSTPSIFHAPPTFFTTPVARVSVSGLITAGLTIVTVSGTTQTLPDATSCSGKVYIVKSMAGVTTTIATTLLLGIAQTIDGLATGDGFNVLPLASFNYQSDGTNWVVT